LFICALSFAFIILKVTFAFPTPILLNQKFYQMKNLRVSIIVVFLVFCFSLKASPPPPSITLVSALPATPLKFDKYEITFTTSTSTGGTANPYDPSQFDYYAEFWSPSGKYYKVNAFFFTQVNNAGCPWVDPAGDGSTWQMQQTLTFGSTQNWKVRFTPNESGTWSYRVYAFDINGAKYIPSATTFNTFSCSSSSSSTMNAKGFISKANQRYLKFDDGSPFYPVGDNAPFFAHNNTITPGDPSYIEGGSCLVKSWMDEMYANNENFFVYDINFFYGMSLFGPDYRDGKNYYSFFNQRDSWQLDDIIDYAHLKGIYLDLPVFSHSDLGNLSYNFYKWSLYNPFNSSVSMPFANAADISGTCATPFDFLTNTSAIQIQKNLLRYIVARWGYSNNVMSWELLDEVDQFNGSYDPDFSGGQPALTTNIANWHISTKSYINSIDPQKHLVCTGNKNSDPNIDVAMNDAMDFTIGKVYDNQGPAVEIGKGGWNNVDMEKTCFDISGAFISKYYKPFFMVEFGYFTDNWFELPDYDKTMYGLHGHLWSSLFSGAMGPSCFWTHHEITYDKPLALNNFKGVGTFTKNSLPLLSEEFQPFYISSTGASGFKVYYLKNTNSDIFYGWAQDLNYDFKTLLRSTLVTEYPSQVASGGQPLWMLHPTPPPYLQDLTTNKPAVSNPYVHSINFSVGKNGIYDVTWYNTEDGTLYSGTGGTTTATSTSNSITITMPIALRMGKYGDATFKVEYRCASQWNASVLNAAAPSNALTGSDIEMSQYGNVFFVGNDNRVHIMYNNGGFYWSESALNSNTGIVRAGSDLARGNYDQINYIATDNKVHQYYWNGTTWIEALLCSTTNTVRSGSSLACDANGNVYYIAQDNKMHIYWYDQTNHVWAEGILNSTTMLARTDSDITIDNAGNVIYTGTDNRLHRHFWNTSTNLWNNAPLNASAPTNVKAGSALTCDANGHVYFVATDGTNGRIHRYTKSGSTWTEVNYAPGTPTNTIKALSDLTVIPGGSIFFVGTDNRVHTYWLSGSTWIEAVLNTNDPVNATRFLASDGTGNIFYNSTNVSSCGNRIYVNYYGCQSAFKLSDDTNSTETVAEQEVEAFVNLFPNPNNGTFKVEFINFSSEKLSLKVFNSMGQIVFEKDIADVNASAYNVEINLSGQSNGIYFVQIIGEDKSYFKRFNIINN